MRVTRTFVGQPDRAAISACCDEHSLWVELRRTPYMPWEMSPERAREVALVLIQAAYVAETLKGESR